MPQALRLTLLRHAHAEPKQPQQTDIERALDRRGLGEAAEMARRLAIRELVPDCILVSPAVRTRQTAAAFERRFALTATAIVEQPTLYLAEAMALLEHARNAPDSARHVLLVAHNPGISDLAHALLPGDGLTEFDPAAMISCELACSAWREFDARSIRARWYDAPRFPFELDG